jgi:hypothetical protein
MLQAQARQNQSVATTAATTATAKSTAAATTAATAASRLVLRFIDAQWATAHVLTVQVLDGTGSIGTGHFDKAETAWTASITIIDQGNRFDSSVRFEQRTNSGFIGSKGQVAHVNLAH